MFSTIEDFKSAVTGIAPLNKFRVIFSPNGRGKKKLNFFQKFNQNEYQYLVMNVSIPGQTLNPVSTNFWGIDKKIASGIYVDKPIMITWLCDHKMKIRTCLEEWIDMIFDKTTCTVSYFDDYVVDAVIQVLNRKLEIVKEYKLKDAWPTNISSVNLSYAANDEAMTFTSAFDYTFFEVTNYM